MKKIFKNIYWQNKQTEKVVFLIATVINMLPILMVKHFGSMDSPQHLYVSEVIGELWKNNELFHQFFKINDIPVGNWTGHFLLTVYNLILPGWIAEKLLFITYFLGIAYSFRYLIISIRGNPTYMTLLILPFSYTSLFLFGYYNFSLAFLPFFVCFGYWINIENNLNIKKTIVLALLITILYFSHIFVFTFFGLSLIIYVIYNFIADLLKSPNKRFVINNNVVKILVLSVSSSLSIFFWFIYKSSFPNHLESVRLNTSVLFEYLYKVRNLLGYDYVWGTKITVFMFYFLVFILFTLFIVRIVSARRKQSFYSAFFKLFSTKGFWGLLTIVFAILYFTIPDRMSAGSISLRLSIIFYFIVIVWISIQKHPRWLTLLSVFFIIAWSIQMRTFQSKFMYYLNKDIKEINELNNYVEPNSLMFGINCSNHWVQIHFTDYIGAEVPMINVAGPECNGMFPIIRNYDKQPVVYLGSVDINRFCRHCSSADKKRPLKIVDYIVLWGARNINENCIDSNLFKIIKRDYKIKYISSRGNAELYQFNLSEKIERSIKKIKSDESWRKSVEQKAIKRKIPFDEMILREALFL
ncbi:MAG: hypothetical protein K8R68_05470, partial [Bacteroidales bacterium]|nr:hypothetical protein [Bacteroidales bacterium]